MSLPSEHAVFKILSENLDCILHVISFLSLPNALSARRTNRKWKDIVESSYLPHLTLTKTFRAKVVVGEHCLDAPTILEIICACGILPALQTLFHTAPHAELIRAIQAVKRSVARPFKNTENLTPIVIAAANGHTSILKSISEFGLCSSFSSHSLLVMPIKYGHAETVEFLLSDKNMSTCLSSDATFILALAQCIEMKNSDILKILIAKRFEPNSSQQIKNFMNSCFLSQCTSREDPFSTEAIHTLIGHGCVDPNMESQSDGQITTPLTEAIFMGRVHNIRVLLENGANPNLSGSGKHPLFLTIDRRPPSYTKIIKLLLEHGADHSVSRQDGITPLFSACDVLSSWHYRAGETLGMVKELVGAGADVNISPKDGHETPLTCAIKNADFALVLFLIESGAAVNFQSKRTGESVLDVAEKACAGEFRLSISDEQTEQYRRLIRFLEMKGAKAKRSEKMGCVLS